MKRLAKSVVFRRVVVALLIIIVLWLNVSGDDLRNQVADTWTYIRGSDDASPADVSCYGEYPEGGIGEIGERDTAGLNGRAIFFHETSCFVNASKAFVNPRQACAVESAALTHPNHTVFLLYTAPVPQNNEIHQILQLYPNVVIRRVILAKYTKNTPLEEWYKSDPLQKSNYARSHASDLLRYLSLWKYGGLYLDLDVIMLRNTDDLHSNFAGAESRENIAAGVLKFDHFGFGHRMAEACLRDLRTNFKGKSWGNNGPGVITRVLKRQCNTRISDLMNRERCKGFMVYGPNIFYPVTYQKWKWYMKSEYLNSVNKLTKNSYAIHVWNKFSHKIKLPKKSNAAYAKYATKYCPKVFNSLTEDF